MKPNQAVTDHSESNLYRLIPSLHELLLMPGFAALLEIHSRDSVISAAHTVLARLKQEIAEGHHTQASLESELALLHVTVGAKSPRARATVCGASSMPPGWFCIQTWGELP